jgi:hypothetical protein
MESRPSSATAKSNTAEVAEARQGEIEKIENFRKSLGWLQETLIVLQLFRYRMVLAESVRLRSRRSMWSKFSLLKKKRPRCSRESINVAIFVW